MRKADSTISKFSSYAFTPFYRSCRKSPAVFQVSSPDICEQLKIRPAAKKMFELFNKTVEK